MARQNPRPTVQRDFGILHVNVIDTIWEIADEFGGINSLPNQVAGIEIESKLFAATKRSDRSFCRVDVERNLGRMNFEGKFDPTLLKHIQNWIPAVCK